MGSTTHEEENEIEEQAVPEGALDGIRDIVEGRLATKEDLADALKF